MSWSPTLDPHLFYAPSDPKSQFGELFGQLLTKRLLSRQRVAQPPVGLRHAPRRAPQIQLLDIAHQCNVGYHERIRCDEVRQPLGSRYAANLLS